ncbi:MAG: hypothetical protein AB7C95_00880 [Synergistaceae bacterium]
MAETIVQILMRRDGNTEEEAKLRVDECAARMREVIAQGDYLDTDDIIAEELGLEPDYCFEILGF